MSTQHQPRRSRRIGRRAALAASAIAALAIAAPGAEASAAATLAVPPPAARESVVGPTLIGDVFNGSTVILTSPSPTARTIVGSG
jgi:hypothetical protein